MTHLSAKEKALVSVQDEIRTLEQKLENMEIAEPEIDVEQLILENKIPRERELDEYILSLNQLEIITESKIEKIEFVYDSNLENIEAVEEENQKDEEVRSEERRVGKEERDSRWKE